MSYNIYLIGEVSSGKSSVLNSMVGGLVSNSSLQRETLNPISVEISPTGTEDNIRAVTSELEVAHKITETKRSNITKLNINELDKIVKCKHILPSRYNLGNLDVVDFPGINDTEDIQDLFMRIFENKLSEAHLVVYVTDASKAFISMAEVKNFKKIKNAIDKYNTCGKYIDLIILVNKFDDLNDESLNEIYDKISKKTKIEPSNIIKYSSHRTIIKCIVDHRLSMYVPKTKTNYIQREVIKILKNSNVNQTVTLIDSIKNSHILKYEDISFGCNPNWDDPLSESKSESESEQVNQLGVTGQFFDYLALSCSKNMTKQLESFNTYHLDLLKKIIQETSSKKIIKLWNKIKFAEIISDETKTNLICDTFANSVNLIKLSYDRYILLELMFDYAILVKSNTLIFKICDLISKSYKLISVKTSQYIFYRYITSGAISLGFEIDLTEWLMYIFSTDNSIYQRDYMLKIYDIERNQFKRIVGVYADSSNSKNNCENPTGTSPTRNAMHCGNWYINELINNEHTPHIIKSILKLTKYSIDELFYLDDIGKLQYTLVVDNKFAEEHLATIFHRIIANLRWISRTGTSDMYSYPAVLFRNYVNSEHESVLIKIMSDFSGGKSNDDASALTVYHKDIFAKEKLSRNKNKTFSKCDSDSSDSSVSDSESEFSSDSTSDSDEVESTDYDKSESSDSDDADTKLRNSIKTVAKSNLSNPFPKKKILLSKKADDSNLQNIKNKFTMNSSTNSINSKSLLHSKMNIPDKKNAHIGARILPNKNVGTSNKYSNYGPKFKRYESSEDLSSEEK